MKHMDIVKKALFLFVLFVGVFGAITFTSLFVEYWEALRLSEIIMAVGLSASVEMCVAIALLYMWNSSRE